MTQRTSSSPTALTTDGTNVWIGEIFGRRAMKFTSDGAFVAQIGKAAGSVHRPSSGKSLIWPWTAVAISGLRMAHHVLKFDAAEVCERAVAE